MAEVGLADPGGHDQAVVGDLEGLDADDAGVHDPAVKVEPGDLGQLDADVLVLAEHVADGRRDLAGRDHARRHLVQERLEQVVVAPVDHGHVDVLAGQEAGRRQAAEAPADDHHPVAGGPVGAGRAHPRRSVRCSPTRRALAMAVRAGLTAPMLGKKLVSTT